MKYNTNFLSKITALISIVSAAVATGLFLRKRHNRRRLSLGVKKGFKTLQEATNSLVDKTTDLTTPAYRIASQIRRPKRSLKKIRRLVPKP